MALLLSTILGLCLAWAAAFVVGVVIGWTWKPKWTSCGRKPKFFTCSVAKSYDSLAPSTSSPNRSVTSPLKGFGSAPCLKVLACDPWDMASVDDTKPSSPSPASPDSWTPVDEKLSNIVTEDDLQHLVQLIERKDGGPTWMQMMDRFMPGMRFQAWLREHKICPTQYFTRTVFENATPEMVRDFFWDDEFRSNWDNMLAHSKTIEECPSSGTMIVQWIRKFPFYCSDREYIIGRRIWECNRSFYCVTKGVPHPSIPRRNKPRRVDLYFSSWCIRAVESRRGDGQMSACEVLLFHHEDMGIPREIAKNGVQQGMWGAVKKIEPGFRAYQKQRMRGGLLSRSAIMAQINNKLCQEYLISLRSAGNLAGKEMTAASDKQPGGNVTKLLVLGGVVLLACTLDKGPLAKAFMIGVGRRFANMGRRT